MRLRMVEKRSLSTKKAFKRKIKVKKYTNYILIIILISYIIYRENLVNIIWGLF